MASSFEIHARHHWSFQLVLMGSRLQLEGCRDGEEPLRCSTLAGAPGHAPGHGP